MKSQKFKDGYAQWKLEQDGKTNSVPKLNSTSEEVEHHLDAPTPVTSSPSNQDRSPDEEQEGAFVHEILNALTEQVGITRNLMTTVDGLKTDVQTVDARVEEIENTRTVKTALVLSRFLDRIAEGDSDEDEEDDDGDEDEEDELDAEEEDDEPEWTAEEIEAAVKKAADSYSEKYAEMFEESLSRYSNSVDASLSKLDKFNEKLAQEIPKLERIIKERQNNHQKITEFERNMKSYIRRGFSPLHRQVEEIKRDVSRRYRAVPGQNAG